MFDYIVSGVVVAAFLLVIATDAGWIDRSERERDEAPDRALQLIGLGPGMSVADGGLERAT